MARRCRIGTCAMRRGFVDWYVPSPTTGDASRLRRELSEYLQRHAVSGSDLMAAELVAAELFVNVVRHAQGPMWVSLTWTGENPVLRVSDLGPGFDLSPSLPVDSTASGGRGLFLVSNLTKELEVAARRRTGTIVSVVLPVTRPPSASYDPPRHHDGALPALDEALPEGGFGKESFLRALVVQLSQAVEANEGPAAAEAAVAQVGADVGGQMEAEYRAAKGIVGRMTPEQIADCYVRLKHAIDGHFTIEEVTADRLVLTSTCCPFGEAVRAAPALCRMTSSVFGGIAARNSGKGALVLLEERVAVGDPGCRVVVWLTADQAEVPPWSHRYHAPLDGEYTPH